MKRDSLGEDNGDKKILVIGAGSIGRRHAANLKSLGCTVHIHDVAKELLGHVCSECGYVPVPDLKHTLKTGDLHAAVICTPTNLHVSSALDAVDAGLDIFVEKPLSDSLNGVEELVTAVKRSRLVAMAGFNLRYERGLEYLKSVLNPSDIAFARIEFGSYLPGWRKGVDYRKIYSANRSMGGGIILDDVHELDYACWLMGYPDSVRSSSGRFSALEIDVEDVADFQFRYPDKLVTIHIDYLQRRYTRTCKICLSDGTLIEWEFGKGVTKYSGEGCIPLCNYEKTFDANEMYLKEMSSWLECIKTRSYPESDLDNAVAILKIALQAKNND